MSASSSLSFHVSACHHRTNDAAFRLSEEMRELISNFKGSRCGIYNIYCFSHLNHEKTIMCMHARWSNTFDQLPISGKDLCVFFYSTRKKRPMMMPEYAADIVKFLYVLGETWKHLPPWCASQFPSWPTEPHSSRGDLFWYGFRGICSMFSIHWMSKGFSSSSCKIPENQLCLTLASGSSRGNPGKKRSKSVWN